ncbi:Hydroxyacylglutathione hydrolase cytoplasmic [Smittium culicis]|uniref:hydroxyacylglutathione hydrolase n=2 Tax=Smittium culicis TaxID=133412 RepID=A0A1R1XU75_9FUNG|nr:Hydroxyacylglutathione hydrolase cytoplasmic [Smittium culicis]
MRIVPVPVWSDNYAYLLIDEKAGDHAGGNEKMTELIPGLTVYGGDNRIPAMTSQLNGGEEFMLGSLKITAIRTLGHTDSSISYYVQDGDDKAVFTGDTLFIAGCGRLFEGTPEQMHDSLNVKFASLPEDTKVYVGHEYTRSNIRFALSVDPNNSKLKEMADIYNQSKMTIPSTIKIELETNPFMRVTDPAIQKVTGETDPVKVLGALRSMKDRF